MRHRERILASLDKVYREAFEAARAREDSAAADRLDFEYQRDQIRLEVMLDLRDLLFEPDAPAEDDTSATAGVSDLIDKARTIRKFTRLR
ncbi:hypothetical protein [Gaopeijia maritima]|uniref:Uncharacterized protein n=1 Tax=Gaopeijia maritima TaxID=3119007 RepID=A0ABU9E4V9_9BACT